MEYEKPNGEDKMRLINLGYTGDISDWLHIQAWLWEMHQVYISCNRVKGDIKFVGTAVNMKTKSIIAVPSRVFDSPHECIIAVVKEALRQLSEK